MQETIILKIAKGDQEALGQLYALIKDAVYVYAYSFLKNPQDAEDILHESFVRIWVNARQYKSQGKPMAWVYTIVRNLCLEALRKNKKISPLPQDESAYSTPEPVSSLIEDKLYLSLCMTKLPRDEREILLLHALSGLKHKEIASMLHQPLGTVLSKYHRAIKKMKTMLEKEYTT